MVSAASNADHAAKLAAAHRARLEQLEIQAAKFGNSTPPHILTEIEEIRELLVNHEGVTAADTARYQALIRAVMLLSSQISETKARVDQLYWVLPLMMLCFLVLYFIVDHL